MILDEIQITSGANLAQKAYIERNDKTIDYETSRNLDYSDIISITMGLNAISEFYDVQAAISVTPIGICAAALGKTLENAVTDVMDSNPIDFIASTIVLSNEVSSDTAKLLKDTKIVTAPSFTKNAYEYLNEHNVCCVTIKTPLSEYKKYLPEKIEITPLGTLTQAPNYNELDKDSFKVLSKTKPTVEQIEDAVFAWKIAKHTNSRAIVIAKDLKTNAIAQGLQTATIEYVLDYSCDKSKEAVLASDMNLTVHDINVAAQGRIALVIVPDATKEIVALVDKLNIGLIKTGFTNILY